MSSIWQMGKHKAWVLQGCLALLTVSAGCDPSSGFIWCRRQVLLTSLEKVKGVTRKVEAEGPVALAPPWRKAAMGLCLPTKPWPTHRICSCCYLKHWKDVNWIKRLERFSASDLLSSHVPSSSDVVSGDTVHLQQVSSQAVQCFKAEKHFLIVYGQ